VNESLGVTKGFFPSLVLLLAVVVAAVPWALPVAAGFVLPLQLIIFVFALSLQRKYELPTLTVFAAGLLMDVLTAGPLGYWAIIFLITHTLARFLARRTMPISFLMLWVAFAATAATASITGWALASLYFVRLIDWQPMLIVATAAVALFPLISWPLRRSLGLMSRSETLGRRR